MSNAALVVGTPSSVTVTPWTTLASGNYGVSADIALGTAAPATSSTPAGGYFEVSFTTTNTPTGNQSILLFATASFDGGTTYTTGPTSGTSRVHEPNLFRLGALRLTAAGTERVALPAAPVWPDGLPTHVRVVAFNDAGVAMTGATLRWVPTIGDIV